MPGRLFPKPFEGQAPQEFGIGANVLKIRTFDLTVARNLEQIEIGGSCIWAVAATSLNAVIDFRVNDQLRDPLPFQQGMFVGGIPFSRVYASHAAQPGETITVFFAVEEDIAQIRIVNPSLAFNEVNLTKAAVFWSDGDFVAVPGNSLVLAANANRRVLYLSSLITNIHILRIGAAPAAADNGTPLAPGETMIIEVYAAIRTFNPGAINQHIAVSYTED